MRKAASSILFLLFGSTAAMAQAVSLFSDSSMAMEKHGGAVTGGSAVQKLSSYELDQFPADISPPHQLSELAQNTVWDATGTVRSVRGQQIYHAISPSVVLIATKDGLGSGSLLDTSGDILTNWHVVKGYQYVAIVFTPTVEGKEPTRDEIKRGEVIKYDEIADLALVKTSEVPTGRIPIRLGDSSEIAVGMDVHAIGHPKGEAWTYTAGVISQYRLAYGWQAKDDPIKHRADIIQTQTPISPGSSGGPLLSDAGTLLGVNSFFNADGEGLNFAISVDEVKKSLARPGNRIAQTPKTAKGEPACRPKQLSKFRNEKNDATVISFDMFCSGKDTGELVDPDDHRQAVFLRLDRNGDGHADAIIFDLKRSGKWDLSFWDDKFEGHWTLVGYHDDGGLKPTRFESYAEFQKRMASR